MQSLFYVFIQQLCVRHSAVHTWIEGACVRHLPFPMHFCSLAHYDRTSLWEQLAADWLQFHFFFLSCLLHCVIHEVQHTYWKNSFVKLEKNNLILLWMFQVVKKRKPLARHIQWLCVSLAIVFLWRRRVAPLRVCGRSMSAIASRAERNAWLPSAIHLNVNLTCWRFGPLIREQWVFLWCWPS